MSFENRLVGIFNASPAPVPLLAGKMFRAPAAQLATQTPGPYAAYTVIGYDPLLNHNRGAFEVTRHFMLQIGVFSKDAIQIVALARAVIATLEAYREPQPGIQRMIFHQWRDLYEDTTKEGHVALEFWIWENIPA